MGVTAVVIRRARAFVAIACFGAAGCCMAAVLGSRWVNECAAPLSRKVIVAAVVLVVVGLVVGPDEERGAKREAERDGLSSR